MLFKVLLLFENLWKILDLEPWKISTYPNYDGTGFIQVNRTCLLDPDGHVIEVNQILDGLDI